MAPMLVFLVCSFFIVAHFYQHVTDTIESRDRIAERNDYILHILAYVIAYVGITTLLMISGTVIVLLMCFAFNVSSETVLKCIRWARNVRID